MTDFFIKKIPLPMSRPEMEEIVSGGDNPRIAWKIPFPEMSGMDLTFELDWKDKFMEFMRNAFEFSEKIFEVGSAVLLIAGFCAVLVLLLEGIRLIVRKLH